MKAVYCLHKDTNKWYIQSYVFLKAKGWTMAKAKDWFKSHEALEVGAQVLCIVCGEPATTMFDGAPFCGEDCVAIYKARIADYYEQDGPYGIPDSCICRDCGYVWENPGKHCTELQCPECGGRMYRRPTPEDVENVMEKIGVIGAKMHADFERILGNFINYWGRSKGRTVFADWVKRHALDPEKPYDQAAQRECKEGVCEAFRWLQPAIQYLKEDEGGKYYKVLALSANISMNDNDYEDTGQMSRSAPTLEWKPLDLNHAHNIPRSGLWNPERGTLDLEKQVGFLPFPANRVDLTAFEDNGVECVMRISNDQPEIQKWIDEEKILHVSIEGQPRGAKRTRKGRAPVYYSFTALGLLTRDRSLPGDPVTYLEPLLMNESMGRSLVESMRERRDEKTMTGIDEYSKAPEETPWDLNRADYTEQQLSYASAVVVIDGTVHSFGYTGEDLTKAACKLPHHKPGSGTAHGGQLIWRGVAAAGAALRGARGATITGDAAEKAKAHLAAHYREFDKTPPWTREQLLPEEAEALAALESLDEETKNLYILEATSVRLPVDGCGQCTYFDELKYKTYRIPRVTSPTEKDDGDVSLTTGGLGRGAGICRLLLAANRPSLVRTADPACSDAKPRGTPTDVVDMTPQGPDRMMMEIESKAKMAEKDRTIADLNEKLLDKDRETEKQRDAKLKTQRDLLDLQEKLEKAEKEGSSDASKIARLSKDRDDLRADVDKLRERIANLELDTQRQGKDVEYHKEQARRLQEDHDSLNKKYEELRFTANKLLEEKQDESEKRAAAAKRAQNADEDLARIKEENAQTISKLAEKQREILEYAENNRNLAQQQIRDAAEITKLRKDLSEVVEQLRDAKQELTRLKAKKPKVKLQF